MSLALWKRVAALCVAGLLLVTVVSCSDDGGGASNVSGYNYTSNYIAGFSITNLGQDLSAGGPNIFPKEKGEERSEGGGMCCIGIPDHWRPDMKVVVQWRRDTHPYSNDRSGDQWLTATTKVPPYGKHIYGFVVHFLPSDRIRVQVWDESGVLPKIDAHDPYIAQGVLDPELNKAE
jgi:hypothetical protein